MKLIEAKQAKEFASTFLADKILQAAVNAVLDNAPGFDLVRCKDCHNCTKSKWCNLLMMDVEYEWFCSHGKRRNDG